MNDTQPPSEKDYTPKSIWVQAYTPKHYMTKTWVYILHVVKAGCSCNSMTLNLLLKDFNKRVSWRHCDCQDIYIEATNKLECHNRKALVSISRAKFPTTLHTSVDWSPESKTGCVKLAGWERRHASFLPSIIATIANHMHLWIHVCGREQTALSSECIILAGFMHLRGSTC